MFLLIYIFCFVSYGGYRTCVFHSTSYIQSNNHKKFKKRLPQENPNMIFFNLQINAQHKMVPQTETFNNTPFKKCCTTMKKMHPLKKKSYWDSKSLGKQMLIVLFTVPLSFCGQSLPCNNFPLCSLYVAAAQILLTTVTWLKKNISMKVFAVI